MARTAGVNQRDVQIEIAQDADKVHEWPSQVGIGPDISAVYIYREAQMQRAYGSWTPLDLIELARVSKMIAMADHEWERYQVEGMIVMGGRRQDTPIENPRGRALNTLNSTINSSLRRLGLAAMSTPAEKRTEARKGALEREVRATHAGNEDNDISLI